MLVSPMTQDKRKKEGGEGEADTSLELPLSLPKRGEKGRGTGAKREKKGRPTNAEFTCVLSGPLTGKEEGKRRKRERGGEKWRGEIHTGTVSAFIRPLVARMIIRIRRKKGTEGPVSPEKRRGRKESPQPDDRPSEGKKEGEERKRGS